MTEEQETRMRLGEVRICTRSVRDGHGALPNVQTRVCGARIGTAGELYSTALHLRCYRCGQTTWEQTRSPY